MSGVIGGVLSGTAVVGRAANAAQSIGDLAGAAGDLLSGYLSPGLLNGLGPWAWTLQPASWRGLPFAVRASRIQRGRRTAVHQYPYRDVVWVEDLGRGLRQVSFQAFLVGDDVYAQRDAFSTACDWPGPGTLVHPSLGALSVVNVEFGAGEAAERGRVVELELTFVESGQDQPLYPSDVISTQSNTILGAATADLAAASDFLADTATAVAIGADVVSAGVQTVASFARLADGAISDAGLIANVATGLPDINGGRYASGNQVTPQPTGTTVTSAIAALTVNRAQVSADIEAAEAAEPATMPAAVQQVTTDVAATAQNPADQVRLLANMAAFQGTPTASTAPIGGAIATMQTATAALCRLASLTALARATAAYQPTSYNDAVATLDTVTLALDAEIISAADVGDNATYLALRALRTAVAQDLITRGSTLPQLITVKRGTALPSLVLAYQLYQDATRSDELIARVDPPAPLWMPTTFQALSS